MSTETGTTAPPFGGALDATRADPRILRGRRVSDPFQRSGRGSLERRVARLAAPGARKEREEAPVEPSRDRYRMVAPQDLLPAPIRLPRRWRNGHAAPYSGPIAVHES